MVPFKTQAEKQVAQGIAKSAVREALREMEREHWFVATEYMSDAIRALERVTQVPVEKW